MLKSFKKRPPHFLVLRFFLVGSISSPPPHSPPHISFFHSTILQFSITINFIEHKKRETSNKNNKKQNKEKKSPSIYIHHPKKKVYQILSLYI